MMAKSRNDVLLDVRGAAQRLCATPELLFFYTRHGANGQQLSIIHDAGANLFHRDALDAFDAHLRAPWNASGTARPSIPQGIRDYLKIEAGGGCARCIIGSPLEEAHIESWETTRSHHHLNLLRLCRNCHRLYDERVLAHAEVRAIKARCVARIQQRLSLAKPTGWPIPGAPPAIPRLIGRRQELAAVTEALASGRSIVIEGVGGIGKTQLALHATRTVAGQRTVLWIDAEHVRDQLALDEAIRQQAAAQLLTASPTLTQLLDEARSCLVIDGLERYAPQRDAIVDFIERMLAETSDTLFLITSQMAMPSLIVDQTLRLQPIAADAAKQIMLSGCDPQRLSGGPALDALLEFAEGHPLTLRILSALIRHFGAFEVVLERLASMGSETLEMPRRQQQSSATSLERCLALAFADLTPDEQRLLWVVAMSPSGLRPGLQDLTELEISDPVAAGANLRSWNLIELEFDDAFESGHPGSIYISMLSPIRVYALNACARALGDARVELERRFAQMVTSLIGFIQNHYLRGGEIELGNALMERELANGLTVLDLATARVRDDQSFVAIIVSLANSTMMYLFTSGRFRAGEAVMRCAATAAAGADRLGDALQFLLQMQILAFRADNDEGAMLALHEAEQLGKGAAGVALVLLRQIQISDAEKRGDYDAAATLAQQALALLDAIPDEKHHRGHVAFQLGRALEFGGNPNAALPHFRSALAIFEAEEDPINRGSALHHIGNCQAYGERWREALDAYHAAGRQFGELKAIEFVSNALGEAGLILPAITPLGKLPERELVAMGLDDLVGQFIGLAERPELAQRRLRVTLKKFGGLISLTLHSNQRDLLTHAADSLAEAILNQVGENNEKPPHAVRALLWHVHWLVRLCAFLEIGIQSEQPLGEVELSILTSLASRSFAPPDHPAMAAWIASYLQRRCNMHDVTPASMLAGMKADDWRI